MSAPVPLPSRLRRGLRLLFLLALTGYFAFGALVLGLRYWVVPRMGEYRQEVAEAVGRGLGVPVEIGALEGSWAGLRPRLLIHDVVLRGPDGAPALQLAEVEAVMGWSSLLRLSPVFHRIELAGPRLLVERGADGSLRVAGLPVQAGGGGGFADWLLGQGAIVVRDAQLAWLDRQRGAPLLVLDHVNLRLENRGGDHRFGFQALPPARLAGRLDLRGSLQGRDPTRPEDWRGQLYARLEGADLGGWQAWLDSPVPLAGRGEFEAWLDVAQGLPTGLRANLALAEARVQFQPELPVLDLLALRGQLTLASDATHRLVEAKGLSLATRDGLVIPATDFRAEERLGQRAGGSFRASRLDLATLTRLASHLPLPEGVNQRLTAFDPAGAVEGVALDWTGPAAAPAEWRGKARFQGIGVHSWHSLPGVAGISGEVEGSDQEGRVRIDSRGVVMDLPAVFAEPRLALASLRAEGGWRRRGERMQLFVDKAEFDNQDASGQAVGNYLVAADGPGVIDLSARLTRADGAAVWRYMPLVVNRDTRNWLQRSIVGGTAHDARLRLKGDLRDFPFVGGKDGQFQVRARIANARLEYALGWPAIDAIDGELLFEGAMMKISADRGRIFGVGLSRVSAVLPDLEAPEEIMTITGRAAGPTADFLRFVSESPVAERIQHFTDDMGAEGSGALDLELVMPLRRMEDTTVKGDYRFSANRLRVVRSLPPITEAAGRVAFTASTLAVPEARGKLFGEPLTLSGKTRADGAVVFTAAGALGGNAARQSFGFPFLEHVSGLAPWRSEITVQGRTAAVRVDSSLQGLASSLPAPFNKSATTEWPLRVDLEFHDGTVADRVRVALAPLGSAEILGRSGAEGWRAERGAIALQVPLKLPERGVVLAAALPELDVDAWRRLWSTLGNGEGNGGGEEGGTPFPLASISLQAHRLVAFDEDFHEFSLRASADGDSWQGSLKSRETEGDFRWRGAGQGALTARLSRLAVGRDGKTEAATGAGAGVDDPPSRSLPALDVTIQQFTLGDKALGRLGLQAHNRDAIWHLDAVNLVSPEGALNAKGLWRQGRGERTELDFRVETEDAGHFLTRLGYADALRRGKGAVDGRLEWAGPPTRIDYPSLGGRLNLLVENGQFRKLEPGVGRLLGVLSLQSLPRRITLDFRDVFSEGFAFDRISGSIDVAGGVMRTKDLEIRGPAARVALSGSADVPRETQDLLVRVQPTLSESVAVGAAASLVNPVVGVAAYLAQKVLSDPIEKLFAFEYRVTGHWQDPKVEKLTGQPAAAQPVR
ncbi:MAG: YhdP family protein [Rhodocyclaceae bacterium]|nr:YhdP family protein [Rhodocyclaceae bacterium]